MGRRASSPFYHSRDSGTGSLLKRFWYTSEAARSLKSWRGNLGAQFCVLGQAIFISPRADVVRLLVGRSMKGRLPGH